MLFKPLVGNQLSGSMGGVTASHNKGGTYFRQRATPTNPGTSFQSDIRNIFGDLSSRWTDQLTPSERNSWNTAAANLTFKNRIGDNIKLSGISLYVRNNTSRIQAGLTRVDAYSGPFNNGNVLGDMSLGAPDASAGTVPLSFDNTEPWANTDDAAALVYVSRPQNPAITFFKGPYRFSRIVAGDGTTPPTSPVTVTLPFAISVGQKVFGYVSIAYPDGRLSERFPLGSLVAIP